jgi:peptide deformylase
MPVRPILRLGDPRLRQVAAPVTRLDDPALAAIIADMTETMAAHDGAGLAAPQIGVPLRVVIFGVERNPRYPEAPPVPRTVLINPELAPLDPTLDQGWEGCLSVPGMRGLVPRWRRIRYRGVDAAGTAIEREADGFHARVVQHECDHLDGVLYPDRIRDRRMFGFIAELQQAGVLGGAALPPE